KKSEVDRIKGFVTRSEEDYRAVYGRKREKHGRKWVFFGRSNGYEYLKDGRGGRGFWRVDWGMQEGSKGVFKDVEGEVEELWGEGVMNWGVGESVVVSGVVGV
ncbi:virulence-associated E family protein, partial [Siminovitchia fortis]|uniref:virulence-associated E family protein n=1 Tax=Siminovitchia fortis TaxID=254758 RepID=UPI001C92E63D